MIIPINSITRTIQNMITARSDQKKKEKEEEKETCYFTIQVSIMKNDIN